ncbi:hypothetical protein [Virgisporangium aliadipatigenens]|uniref:hypothetical protein n=1 Tax=Virgisporangium aliadipatigenens TaxID=741659 RepID=UPI001942AFBC|nr:hypothetical protein [Virgisporangium aliadipatigenens]
MNTVERRERSVATSREPGTTPVDARAGPSVVDSAAGCAAGLEVGIAGSANRADAPTAPGVSGAITGPAGCFCVAVLGVRCGRLAAEPDSCRGATRSAPGGTTGAALTGNGIDTRIEAATTTTVTPAIRRLIVNRVPFKP